jgi:3-phenylpropionate/cinnamic acid dioxygenase small subunit
MVSFLTDEELRLRFEVEEFLYREADLLDEQRFEEWLDLFTEDARYYMPIRRNVPVDKRDNENTRERRDMSWFDESKETLRKRVAQIRTGVHWAEEPISRVSHIVSNVRILDTEPEELGMGEIKVRCRFVVYRNRLEDEESIFIGRRTDTLRREGSQWKICHREILLDQNVMLSKNFTNFF